ncbi:universal stress protein UspA [Halalkaliarchaeum desulfuricum]|uniref:Universal stress protein UspA n=1 Tax=Halalkaliarchaeum desulfuricum TaxID=2055893 RepID=A0A343TMI4_9EURY|nr:universal stress protein [Halalkaliarchaeum desulfuricum]AUX10306.1 universal stress protein UspA [Halalkaliarchaeum desulfuricum]
MTPSHVLVPLDGSPLAADALVYALDVFDCRITVLNVVTPIDVKMSEGGILEPEMSRLEEANERAERLIERARVRAEAADRTVETAIETGDPAETILAYIEGSDVDQVVMGSHGGPRTGVVRRLLGTVATTVTGESPVPVTVVQ